MKIKTFFVFIIKSMYVMNMVAIVATFSLYSLDKSDRNNDLEKTYL